MGLSRGPWVPRKAQGAWRLVLRTQRGGECQRQRGLLTIGEEGGADGSSSRLHPDSMTQAHSRALRAGLS